MQTQVKTSVTRIGAVLALGLAAHAQLGAWSELPGLPEPRSGHYAGNSHGALIIVGGANFPVPLYQGGTKIWYPDVRVLPPDSAQWVTASPLPAPIGYGASVSDERGLICIGGGDATTHSTAVFRLEWTGSALRRTELPSLPQTFAFGGAALLDDVLYVVGGQETPASTEALNILWALDLEKKGGTWKALSPCPGGGRILPLVAAQNGALYVWSGASLAPDAEGKAVRTYLRDGWKFSPRDGWQAIAAPPYPMVAAPVATLGSKRICVFGGDDGALAAHSAELKDNHPGFSRELWIYDVRADAWTRSDTLPVSLVTTNAVKLGHSIIIPGGEDRPGHRNPRVLKWDAR
ncbi:N-acetylneuraminate epimerase [Abditibacteriota bacterium]|nr:N-acetylneuraminate epimerase [Abditibacteriota bacterium]